MCPYAAPFLATVALWWSSTGLILLLDSQDRRTYVGSMIGTSALVTLALWLIAVTASETTAQSAYVAFACGIVVWGWQLLGFYTGFVTGPNKSACAPGSSALSRFVQAVATSVYHEFAAILGAVALAALTYGQPNRIALWTYIILWLMHSSAKLNLFLGVPNLGTEMLPTHLAFLTSYMARRPMNALFPASVTAGTVGSALLFILACRSGASGFEIAGFAMLGSLMALAVVEHWFLVVPIDGNALWSAFRRRRADGSVATATRVERALARAHASEAGFGTELGLGRAFRAYPPRVCDARNIERLLASIAEGRFGDVDCVHGLVQTEADWVCFELKEGRARMAAFGPRMLRKPLVIAKGRGFDQAGLKAAFDGCAAAA
jgi:putative photosynthetic complex assembly protein 2